MGSVFSDALSASRSISAMQRQREADERRGEPCLKVIEAPSVDPLLEMPLLQRVAILGMMNSTLARGVAKRIASAEHCQDRPRWPDYRALVEQGFASKADGEQYHELTTEGFALAQRLVPILCQHYDIHMMQEKQLPSGGVSYRCCCGQWSSGIFAKGGRFTWQRAMQSFYKHVPTESWKAEAV